MIEYLIITEKRHAFLENEEELKREIERCKECNFEIIFAGEIKVIKDMTP